jgi:hypothetical protein
MRDLMELDRFRRRDRHVMENWGWVGDSTAGMFMIPSPIDQKPIAVVASAGEGWDHISVSRPTRCPNWPEMSFIARLFFNDNEVAYQLHLPEAQWISNHPFCLHWWRPWEAAIPLPPSIMVGIKALGTLTPETAKQLRTEADRLVDAIDGEQAR